MDYKYLLQIDSPDDLKKVPQEELPVVAAELRDFMITTVAKVGGHLASSLGTVELTIALHYLFNAPTDKIVWDVGHQAYGHKILTGRRDRFPTLRQYGGISGFPVRDESPYDSFNVAHACTSISGALGMAVARDLAGAHNYVVAVIGDAGLTGGVGLEGLNHVGHLKSKLLIILNDNEMSISPNVGAIAGYLNRIVKGQAYLRVKEEVELLLGSVPKVGKRLLRLTKDVVEAAKTMIIPGLVFEELGFKYVGPLNGHNLDGLLTTLQSVKDHPGPVLLHVVTQKGKGYSIAEQLPVKYHGVTSFDVSTGAFHKTPAGAPSYTAVFGKTMCELAAQDARVVGITAAMPEGTGLDGFNKQFPSRFFDVGIAEQHAVALAAGLARQGARPVIGIYSTFLQRAYDQFIHDVCIQDLPVVFALDRAGIVGDDGKTQQGVFDYSYMRCIPNVVLMAPKDENELQHMLHTALQYDGPIAVRYPRGAAIGVALDEVPQRLPIGKAEVLRRGPDVALLGIGLGVAAAAHAAEHLATEGVSATVVNARFVKPLDRDLILELAHSVGRLVTIEENALAGGFGSAVWELLEHEGVHDCQLHRVGVPDEFVEHGTQASWRKRYGLDAAGVAAAVKQHYPELFRSENHETRRTAVEGAAPSKRQRASEPVGAR